MVKTSRPDLEYELHASNGEISNEAIEEEQITRSFTIKDFSKTIDDFDEYVISIESYEWQIVFDKNMSATSNPTVEVVDGLIVWDKDVIGVLRITYTRKTNYFELTITPQEDTEDPESAYQCTVMAIWAGGIETLEVDAPEPNGFCKGGSFYIGPGGEDDGGEEGDDGKCYERQVKVNSCTLEVLSDNIVQVACQE